MCVCKWCGQKKETKFPDGVQWHVVSAQCDCAIETIPVADNFGEDINLYETLGEFRGKHCEVCKRPYKVIYEKGNSFQNTKDEKK